MANARSSARDGTLEALLGFIEAGLASSQQTTSSRPAISEMVDFYLTTSREHVRGLDGGTVSVITALAPHTRFSRFFAQIKQDLGFGIYVPDCDTTACSFVLMGLTLARRPMMQN